MQTFVVTARTEILAASAEDALQVAQLADVDWQGQAIEGNRLTRRQISWASANTAIGTAAAVGVAHLMLTL